MKKNYVLLTGRAATRPHEWSVTVILVLEDEAARGERDARFHCPHYAHDG